MTELHIFRFLRTAITSAMLQRLTAQSRCVHAVFSPGRLGIAALGRALRTRTTPNQAIKRVDRFLGNPKLDDAACQIAPLRAALGSGCRSSSARSPGKSDAV